MQQRRELHTHHHDPTAIMLRSRRLFVTLTIGALLSVLRQRSCDMLGQQLRPVGRRMIAVTR